MYGISLMTSQIYIDTIVHPIVDRQFCFWNCIRQYSITMKLTCSCHALQGKNCSQFRLHETLTCIHQQVTISQNECNSLSNKRMVILFWIDNIMKMNIAIFLQIDYLNSSYNNAIRHYQCKNISRVQCGIICCYWPYLSWTVLV